ncbi:MAG: hypothetical protein AAFX00_10360 [Pseudomonadota bacterium]
MKYTASIFILGFAAACSPEIQTTSGQAYLAAAPIGDPEIAKAAAVEPNLSFPARVGLVRPVYGQVTTIPRAEMDLYVSGMSENLGSVTQIGQLEARMAGVWRGNADGLRQLAASRHLDLLLVLAFDPGRGTSEALLIDVRSGYPYASVETASDGAHGRYVRNEGRRDRIILELAEELKPELDRMTQNLLLAAVNA